MATSIYNKYVITPRATVEYSGFRGCTDFTQIGLFNQFETGYPWLAVLGIPHFMEKAAKDGSKAALTDDGGGLGRAINQFRRGLEYEFRGLSGLPDTVGETTEITDGINSQKMISKVTRETSVTISMPYFEKTGSLYTKMAEYYLTGIKDPLSQAKTYHGLIQAGDLEPGLEHEVFTFLYWVTDATMVRIEKAWLLCNAQLTKAETSMYDQTRGEISNKEITMEFNAYAITGYEVDQAAYALLKDITGIGYDASVAVEAKRFKDLGLTDTQKKKLAVLDSTSDHTHFGIFDSKSMGTGIQLNNLISRAKKTDSSTWTDPTSSDYYTTVLTKK